MSNELANELSQPTYKFNAKGGFKVESKRDMKLRGVASPNIADALGLTEHYNSIAYRLWMNNKVVPIRGKKRSTQPMPSKVYGTKRRTWMVV